MAPIRRYLRITRYSVLEVRIYAEHPGQVDSWLLKRTDPALNRIITAVQPFVLPKLREESEKAKGTAKKKPIRDVVVGDDFEVSIFLTDLSNRHSLLTKQKRFEQPKPRIKSTSGKLTGWLTAGGTGDKPIYVADDDETRGDGEARQNRPDVLIREEEPEHVDVSLADIPSAAEVANSRKRSSGIRDAEVICDNDDESDALFVNDDDLSPNKRRRAGSNLSNPPDDGDDMKKKLALKTTYDGFSIYGRILCLVVKRKGVPITGTASMAGGTGSGGFSNSQQMMESWVSTQAAAAQEGGADDDE